jgi:hypothetical protein
MLYTPGVVVILYGPKKAGDLLQEHAQKLDAVLGQQPTSAQLSTASAGCCPSTKSSICAYP